MIADDAEFKKKLTALFIETHSAEIQRLPATLESNDLDHIKFVIHKLKGSSRITGAAKVADICLEIEQLVEAKEQEKLIAKIKEIVVEFNLFKTNNIN